MLLARLASVIAWLDDEAHHLLSGRFALTWEKIIDGRAGDGVAQEECGRVELC